MHSADIPSPPEVCAALSGVMQVQPFEAGRFSRQTSPQGKKPPDRGCGHRQRGAANRRSKRELLDPFIPSSLISSPAGFRILERFPAPVEFKAIRAEGARAIKQGVTR